jgi:hypothetical protein
MSGGDNWRVAATIESHAADPQHPDNEKTPASTPNISLSLWQTKEGHRFGKYLEPQRRVTFFALTGNASDAVRAILPDQRFMLRNGALVIREYKPAQHRTG